jgi:hypothetical protein
MDAQIDPPPLQPDPKDFLDFRESDFQPIEIERPQVETCSHIIQIRDGELLTSTIATLDKSVMDRLIALCGSDRRVAISALTRRLNGVLAYKRQQIGDLHRSESGRILWKSMFGLTFNEIALISAKQLIKEREQASCATEMATSSQPTSTNASAPNL